MATFSFMGMCSNVLCTVLSTLTVLSVVRIVDSFDSLCPAWVTSVARAAGAAADDIARNEDRGETAERSLRVERSILGKERGRGRREGADG